MKMIIAILQDAHSDAVAQALLANDFRVTRLASTGGLLRGGRTTLMIGVDDEKVEPGLEIIRSEVPPASAGGPPQATIYVLNVRDFARV